MEPTHAPSLEHIDFDRLCADVQEFEPLPAVRGELERNARDEDETSLDEQILAGLVSPV